MSGDNRNALSSGFEFEGYRIERVLGAGGFGITYLAVETEIGRRVAIKEYLPASIAHRGRDGLVQPISNSQSEGYRWGLDRFQDEARTLTKFSHPNIVSALRFFFAHETAYLVMDYVEGESLGAILQRVGTLGESELFALLRPLLDGLATVHDSGFLHRDIKPDNIYVRGDTGQPVLLDFGAARQALGQATHTLTVIVSHGYAPFEQYTSRGEHGPWSDIYSVGATIYRCISGERPASATDRLDAIFAGRADPNASLLTAGGGRYSSRLLRAVDEALRPQPRERPQSVADFVQLLTLRPAPAPSAPTPEPPAHHPETLVLRDQVRPKPKVEQPEPVPRRPRAPGSPRAPGRRRVGRWLLGAVGTVLGLIAAAAIIYQPWQDDAATAARVARAPTEAGAPRSQGGPQRMFAACRSTWQGSDTLCRCVLRSVGAVLQPGDYDAAIEVLTLLSTNRGDEAKQRTQQIAARDESLGRRIVSAVQNLSGDCKNVR